MRIQKELAVFLFPVGERSLDSPSEITNYVQLVAFLCTEHINWNLWNLWR